MSPLTRRDFSRTLAAAAIAAATSSQAQTGEMLAPAPKPETKPSPKQPDQPFTAPLVFRRNPVHPLAQPFALSQVQLTEGPLLRAREANRAYLNRLSIDRVLHTYRLNAGIPSTAQPFGGWDAPTHPLRGEFGGHYLSAIAMMAAATSDPTLLARTNQLVAGLADCQAKLNADGCLAAFPVAWFDQAIATPNWEKFGVPFYVLHRTMAGLEDAYLYTGNQQALDVVTRIAAWVDAWSAQRSEDQMQRALNVEFGGTADALYLLAEITGNDRWAVTADRFTKKTFMNPLALRRDQLRGLHVNTHIPQVMGASRRYQLSSDPRFHTVAQFFYDTVTTSRTYATGGTGVDEHWLTDPNRLAEELRISPRHQECCCAYNMMKLTRHLYQRTPDPRLFDTYERTLYNHRLGTIQPETGHTQYFLSLTSGAWRTFGGEDQTFWCCNGTAVQEFSKLNDSIYFHTPAVNGPARLYVNLFIPSTLDWNDQSVRLEQATTFPDEPRTRFTLHTSKPSLWTLNLRIPTWAAAPVTVKLNGHELEATATPGSYLSLHRTWADGDHLEMELPMQLTAEPLSEAPMPEGPNLQAILYGPIVLAGQLGTAGLTPDLIAKTTPYGRFELMGPDVPKAPIEVPSLTPKSPTLSDWITPTGHAPLEFHAASQPQPITLVPFYKATGHYAIYWHLT